ncbi:hypothetical protein M2444_000209 [Paenibacillus sp. PastF-3]|jgi:hypothetical protein|nr:hypothetical protein [Paenibacillus sp. PastF-3]
MLKYIHLLGRITIGLSVLIIPLRLGGIPTALIVFSVGILIHLLGLFITRHLQK